MNECKWIRSTLIEDEDFYKILSFFVIHSPCPGQSARGILLTDRGWKPNLWDSPNYLKNKLDDAIFGEGTPLLKSSKSTAVFLADAERLHLGDDFYNHRDNQRAVYTKSSKKGCKSEYMSLFYHIRNSLAHGRFAIYPTKSGDATFVMEDGRKAKGKFLTSARIVINKSSLLSVIELLKNPPVEMDYSSDILDTIKNGITNKRSIIFKLGIDESTYKKEIDLLKAKGFIEYKHNGWFLTNQIAEAV